MSTLQLSKTSILLYLVSIASFIAIISTQFSSLKQVAYPFNQHIDLDWEKLDFAIEDFILRTETPEIELTSAQIDEITILYEDGLEFNNEPEDPCKNLKLLGLKKLKRWVNQFKKRGFTVEKIREILKNGSRHSYVHPSGSNFTRIVHPDGTSIIVDFANCVIWQIAPSDFLF
jgi:hypothetical protein